MASGSSGFMKISNNSDLSGASWETYNTAKTGWTLGSDPDTVYVQFKDSYANTCSIVSITTPETPAAVVIVETSNTLSSPPEYRLFISWGQVSIASPSFKQYNLYRKPGSAGAYSLLTTITDRTLNYFQDTTVAGNQDYYYYITHEDNGNSI